MARGEQGRDLAAPSRPGVGRCESSVSWDVAMPEGHQSLKQDYSIFYLTRMLVYLQQHLGNSLYRLVNNVHSLNKRGDKAGRVWKDSEDTKDAYHKSAAEPTFLN